MILICGLTNNLVISGFIWEIYFMSEKVRLRKGQKSVDKIK